MSDPVSNTIDYITLLMQAIIDGRIEAKTIRDMTPEQREEYKTRLVEEEKAAIEVGYAMHEGESPENPESEPSSDAKDDRGDTPDPKKPREGGGKGNPV